MPKRKYENISDALVKKTRRIVKRHNDLVSYAEKYKGISKAVLPKKANADDILKALGNDPKKLNARLRQLQRFTAKGKVYKTDEGVHTTEHILKSRMVKAGQRKRIEERKLAKAKYLDPDVREYRKNRIKRLEKVSPTATVAEMERAKNAIIDPEYEILQKRTAVTNFKLALATGYADKEDELNALDPHFNERLDRYLNKLTDDEIVDLLENDNTVRQIMEHYREKGDERLKVAGFDYFDLLTDFMQELPKKVRHYKYLRTK